MTGPRLASLAVTLGLAAACCWALWLIASTWRVSREAARLQDHVIDELEKALRSGCQPGRGS